ncbi:hypothetical protein ACFWPU_42800 [Streptomyces sp. NPDC058471]|uniref:hypothetical protein n=1 Tax=Streptomyces sp. NPDC058471 TaxID=3346516 RepID=UPI00364C2F29
MRTYSANAQTRSSTSSPSAPPELLDRVVRAVQADLLGGTGQQHDLGLHQRIGDIAGHRLALAGQFLATGSKLPPQLSRNQMPQLQAQIPRQLLAASRNRETAHHLMQ